MRLRGAVPGLGGEGGRAGRAGTSTLLNADAFALSWE